MHHPPEVRFLADGSPWPQRLTLMVGALALIQVCWFSLLNWEPSWQIAVIGTSFFVAIAWSWLGTQRPNRGHLHWDGLQWQWSGFADGACVLKRHIDFQTLMLVSLHRLDGQTVWLWLQRSQDSQHWLALRRAVVHATAPGQAHRTQGSTRASGAAIA